jgi:segregation and condensation protein B
MATTADGDAQPAWVKGDLPAKPADAAPPAPISTASPADEASNAAGAAENEEGARAAEPEPAEAGGGLEAEAGTEGDAPEADEAAAVVKTVAEADEPEPEASAEPPADYAPALAELADAQPAAEAAAEQETAPPLPAEPLTIPAGEPLALEALVEALLFVADGAAPVGQLAEALEVHPREVEAALAALAETYERRGIHLQRFRDRVQLTTSPGAAAAVERFLGLAAATPLSRAALETLAIIAYQQPVTRPQIEAVRGVNSDSVIKNLLSKGLVEETGRAEGPGRPVLYCTTSEFLQHFGLDTLGQLPPLKLAEAGLTVPTQDEILKG